MMKNFHTGRVVGSGPESLDSIIRLLVADTYSAGVTRIGERDATADDPLGLEVDIDDLKKVKVVQFGEGPELPIALDANAVAAIAVAWLSKLASDAYPKGKGYHDSYKKGWILMFGWRGVIELAPAWIGISK